ncbi:AraC family transcriptional regulator [Veronia nyctiphanis]|uniref:AraC family transcriptional regulator n=1 Tax=Veronia nyctiphanis TaxID=1278244 RepID=A0A4Q0YM56_9GAMM|nr:AraC family transcriptional regulator [Veronia nyctiphanis]RXJ71890.1 AraC family transcriptional regulator [Veronia nyctiphanis]
MSSTRKQSQIIALPNQTSHHAHDYGQVVIGLQGQSEFEVGGRGGLVGPGQGCLVSCLEEHAFSGVGQNEILVINVPVDDFYNQPHVEDKVAQLFSGEAYFQLDNQAQLLIKALSTEMAANPGDFLLSAACADTLVCVLQNHFKERVTPRRHGHRLNMDVIDRYIHAHISRKIGVAQLAGTVFLAESQFHQLFKEQVGMTPHQYVLEKRFTLARQLIHESQLSMAQIADSCGFASQSGFTSAFSRYFGVSPSRYRTQQP